MSALRDALVVCYDGPEGPWAESTIDSVLASPEMQAIKIALRVWWPIESDRSFATAVGLPESVIEWVLS